jgi:hypothetical protein
MRHDQACFKSKSSNNFEEFEYRGIQFFERVESEKTIMVYITSRKHKKLAGKYARIIRNFSK